MSPLEERRIELNTIRDRANAADRYTAALILLAGDDATPIAVALADLRTLLEREQERLDIATRRHTLTAGGAQ